MEVQGFAFNPFSENTWLLWDETLQAVVIDPGMSNAEEEAAFSEFVAEKALKLVRLLHTHCHIDHILGNRFIQKTYGLLPECHELELFNLENGQQVGQMYGIPMVPSPLPEKLLKVEDGTVSFGNTTLEMRFTPGHSAGSISFIHHESGVVVGGDVLFEGSIGRTDLPGGDFDTLAESIRTQLYTLPDDFVVLSGHGQPTSIGRERKNNPYVKG